MAWYSDYENYLIEATSLLYSLHQRVPNDNDLLDFFSDLQKEFFTKFIFESNNIEREGLEKGETRKLIFDMFEESELTEALERFQKTLFNIKYEIIPKKNFNPDDIDPSDFDLAVKYKGKKKDIRLVLNSFKALMTAQQYIEDYLENIQVLLSDEEKSKKILIELKSSDYYFGGGSPLSKFIRFLKNKKDNEEYLFSEAKIKNLHKILSAGLDNNDNGEPGEYRPEPAHIGDFKTVFIEPSLIEKSMQNLIKKHQERYKKSYYNPFIEACKFTGDFNIIHPFGDYNGRIARIMLNMILQLEIMPFYLILRSNARDKRKYMTAMKHYYQGRPTTYLALVCKVFIDEVSSINSRLKMAELEPIKPVKFDDKTKEFIKKSLNDYKSDSKRF